MSIESCTDFLRVASTSPELRQQLKAVTGAREMVLLGRRHGHDFDLWDLVAASSAFEPPGDQDRDQDRDQDAERAGHRAYGARAGRGDASRPVLHHHKYGHHEYPHHEHRHHEYLLADIPGLHPVIDALPRLKVRPSSVDLAGFRRRFRADDLASTSLSPADPAFRAWHEEMTLTGWRSPGADRTAPRRDFHLINLDEQVDHPGYDRYFEAKLRTVSALEEFFGAEVRSSGCLWYPPSSYRLWHTNQTQPGWRMYVIDFDGPFDDPAESSFFRYLDPRTREIVTLRERPLIVRFFKAEQDPDRLFWHCVVNSTARHRWSFGFVVPENWIDAVEGPGA